VAILMRIGMPTTSFPRSATDPAGRFVLELAARLAALGHGVEVLAPEPSAGALPSLPRGVSLSWVPYLRPRALARTFYGAGVLENLARDPWAWPGAATHPLALAAAIATRLADWDAVVSHWALPCGLAASLAMRWAGRRPHACVVHSGDAHLLARLPGRARLAALLAADATLFASSSVTRDVLRSAFSGAPPEIAILPMGTDEPRVSVAEREAARAAAGVAASRVLFVSLARLVPIKRVDLAIDAVRSTPGAELAVAGEGPLRGALEERARGAEVRFLGPIGPVERRTWLAAGDALVLASTPRSSGRTEGAPVSVLEALGAGLPVVASRAGGVVDFVRHEQNGLLVPAGDGVALAGAVRRLTYEPGLREALARGARETRVPTMHETARTLARSLVQA
jgi:glycosyltransferase involved in cell wall biosynthesis